MLKQSPIVYICSLYLFTAASALFGETSCALLEGAKAETRLAYLQRARKELDVNCILFAIVHLGTEKYAPASETLVNYLDYRVPEDPRPKHSFDHVPMVWDQYPAATALFSIGEATVPDVIALIADAEASDLSRLNAMVVIHAMYAERPPESVAALARAARERSKSDVVAGNRLWQAARDVAAMCLDRHKTACFAALVE